MNNRKNNSNKKDTTVFLNRNVTFNGRKGDVGINLSDIYPRNFKILLLSVLKEFILRNQDGASKIQELILNSNKINSTLFVQAVVDAGYDTFPVEINTGEVVEAHTLDYIVKVLDTGRLQVNPILLDLPEEEPSVTDSVTDIVNKEEVPSLEEKKEITEKVTDKVITK